MQIQTQGWLLSREVTQTPYGLMKVLEHFGIVVPLDSIASAIKIYNERGGIRTLAVIINEVMIVIREWNGKEKHSLSVQIDKVKATYSTDFGYWVFGE